MARCPICDAEPGEPCYDPHGNLPYKGKHHGRVEAEIGHHPIDVAYHQSEINRINQEISRLMARRYRHEKALRDG